MKSFMELVQSEPFCQLLSHITGLDLAHNIIRPKLSTDEQTDSESEEGCSIKEDNPTNQGSHNNKLPPCEGESEKNGKSCS